MHIPDLIIHDCFILFIVTIIYVLYEANILDRIEFVLENKLYLIPLSNWSFDAIIILLLFSILWLCIDYKPLNCNVLQMA